MPTKSKPASAFRWVFAIGDTSLRTPGSKYPTIVPRGHALSADDPLVRAHPSAFSDTPVLVWPRGFAPPAVEQATAAPGETRDTGRG
jgi:hypothetical protein